MAVYVDNVRHKFGRMIMCHLWADTLEELLAMVDKIGVQRKWIQGHPELSFGKHRLASWVHFDISVSMKKRVLALGGILTDKYGPVEYEARGDIKTSTDAVQVERAQNMLRTIKSIRERRYISSCEGQ